MCKWREKEVIIFFMKNMFARYASRVKLITNDASKNSDNKEIARLKAVSCLNKTFTSCCTKHTLHVPALFFCCL